MAVEIDKKKCTGCRQCVDICPVEAITVNDNKYQLMKRTVWNAGHARKNAQLMRFTSYDVTGG